MAGCLSHSREQRRELLEDALNHLERLVLARVEWRADAAVLRRADVRVPSAPTLGVGGCVHLYIHCVSLTS